MLRRPGTLVATVLVGACAIGCGGPGPAPPPVETVHPTTRPAAPADGARLAYRRPAGSHANFQIRVQAEPLTMDALDARSILSERVTESAELSFSTRTVLRVIEGRYRSKDAHGSYTVAPDGKLTNLKSTRMEDPVCAAFVHDSALLYAPLPNADVRPGISWTGSVTLHIPLPGMPISLPPIPVFARFTLAAIEKGPRGPIARISVRADAAPRQLVSATMTGVYYFDLAEGRAASALLTGPIDARRLGIADPFPVTVTVSTDGVPSLDEPGESKDRGK